MAIGISKRTVHTLHIDLGDTLAKLNLDPMDEVEIQFYSNAVNNRRPAPVKLSWSTLQRLTRDDSN